MNNINNKKTLGFFIFLLCIFVIFISIYNHHDRPIEEYPVNAKLMRHLFAHNDTPRDLKYNPVLFMTTLQNYEKFSSVSIQKTTPQPNYLPAFYEQSPELIPVENIQIKIPSNNLTYYRNLYVKTSATNRDAKYIYIWDDAPIIQPYDYGAMHLGLGRNVFKNCPINYCFLIHRKNVLPIEKFDAILFPAGKWESPKQNYPEKREAEQKYVYWNWKPPVRTSFDEEHNEKFYNWTMTYRRDSDIHMPFGIFEEINATTIVPKEELKNRKKSAAWHSNYCNTDALKHTKLIKELSQYVRVDIIGDCLKHCPFLQCHLTIYEDYKFYLILEDSNCIDYVTDHLYGALEFNLVPVVFSELIDYKTIMPENSYIDANNFKTIKELALYLKHLENDADEYAEYFRWKSKLRVDSSTQYGLCQLCEKLHQPVEYSSYVNIKNWYSNRQCNIPEYSD